LAVILCHARRNPELQGVDLSLDSLKARNFALRIDSAWARKYPQSAHLLREEVLAWQKTPWTLTLTEA